MKSQSCFLRFSSSINLFFWRVKYLFKNMFIHFFTENMEKKFPSYITISQLITSWWNLIGRIILVPLPMEFKNEKWQCMVWVHQLVRPFWPCFNTWPFCPCYFWEMAFVRQWPWLELLYHFISILLRIKGCLRLWVFKSLCMFLGLVL